MSRFAGPLPASDQHPAHGSTLGTDTAAVRPGGAIGFRRGAGSPKIRLAASFGGEMVESGKVRLLKVWVLLKDLLLGHSCAEPAENIPHGNAEPSDAGFAATLARLDGDPATDCRHALSTI